MGMIHESRTRRRGCGRRAGAVAAAALALAGAEPASGSTWDAGTRPPGAVLAGNGSTWLTHVAGGRALYSARPGRKPRRVDTFPHPGEPGNSIRAFDGSRSAVVLESEVYVPDGGSTNRTSFYAGRFGERLELLGRCDSGLGPGLGRTAVSGATVAFVRCNNTIEVRDLSGSVAPKVVGYQARAVRLAGHYVAWLEGEYDGGRGQSEADIVVYDLQAGVEAYRIPAGAIATGIVSLSLQDDGKVAFVFDPSADDTSASTVVAWASPSQPSVHRVPLPRRLGYSVLLARNRIVFAAYRDAGDGVSEQIGVTDLKGHSRLILRKGSGLGIDYDGKNIAYTFRACKRYTVVRQPLSARKHPSSRSCRK
jgi:hypothetical protein